MSEAISESRGRAARALVRVLSEGAYAAPALDGELQGANLDPRDAALATELVYGVLRTYGFLVEQAERISDRGQLFEEPAARAHLLMGMYSLAFLDLPAFAAVSEAVVGVRSAIGDKPAAFANRVLRTLQRDIERRGKPALELAVHDGAPGWLRGALRRSLGRDGARKFLAASARPAPTCLAVGQASERQRWLEELGRAAPSARLHASERSPHCIVAEGLGDVRRLPGFERDWIVQEEGAQITALALGVRDGEAVLDACAGRGNKTWLLAHAAKPRRIVAVDKHPAKIEVLKSRLRGLANVEAHAVDWSLGAGDIAGGFDRVMVDAPCTGTGTLRRRPEIALRRTEESLAELSDLQVAIVQSAAGLARPGARLLYSVCSVLKEECEGVVERLVHADAPVVLRPEPLGALGLTGTSMRLTPHEHGTDGFFLASFVVAGP